MKRILLIDDDPSVLKALQREFHQQGWECFAFANPQDAIIHACTQAVSVIISDYRMPDIDGGELMQAMQELQPNAYRILLSGQADYQALVDTINAGCVHQFVNKPWNRNALQAQANLGLEHFQRLSQSEFEDKRRTLSPEAFHRWTLRDLRKRSSALADVQVDERGWIELPNDPSEELPLD